MLLNVRLDEDRGLLGIDANREPVEQYLVAILLHLARVRVIRHHRVPVDDAPEAIIFILQLHPVNERSRHVAVMETPRGPHTAENPLSLIHHTKHPFNYICKLYAPMFKRRGFFFDKRDGKARLGLDHSSQCRQRSPLHLTVVGAHEREPGVERLLPVVIG
ncbi:hypothetical protein SDC9_159925 [bioreactor metagenome]|uniref:Uncharacterized protein n=1 Tax=bioreactor metagenome TaxID=1076179 RepID=A0A645FE73_9ZZZZ